MVGVQLVQEQSQIIFAFLGKGVVLEIISHEESCHIVVDSWLAVKDVVVDVLCEFINSRMTLFARYRHRSCGHVLNWLKIVFVIFNFENLFNVWKLERKILSEVWRRYAHLLLICSVRPKRKHRAKDRAKNKT